MKKFLKILNYIWIPIKIVFVPINLILGVVTIISAIPSLIVLLLIQISRVIATLPTILLNKYEKSQKVKVYNSHVTEKSKEQVAESN